MEKKKVVTDYSKLNDELLKLYDETYPVGTAAAAAAAGLAGGFGGGRGAARRACQAAPAR